MWACLFLERGVHACLFLKCPIALLEVYTHILFLIQNGILLYDLSNLRVSLIVLLLLLSPLPLLILLELSEIQLILAPLH